MGSEWIHEIQPTFSCGPAARRKVQQKKQGWVVPACVTRGPFCPVCSRGPNALVGRVGGGEVVTGEAVSACRWLSRSHGARGWHGAAGRWLVAAGRRRPPDSDLPSPRRRRECMKSTLQESRLIQGQFVFVFLLTPDLVTNMRLSLVALRYYLCRKLQFALLSCYT